MRARSRLHGVLGILRLLVAVVPPTLSFTRTLLAARQKLQC